MAVVIPHPCFVSSPGRSHLTHSPLTTHRTATALSHFPQDSRRVCEGEMRCGVAVVGLLFAHKGLTQVRQLKVNRLAIFMSRCHHHQPFSILCPPSFFWPQAFSSPPLV